MLGGKEEFIKESVHYQPQSLDMAIRLFTIFQKASKYFFIYVFFSLGASRGICHLPPEKGPCKAYMPRYYFDPAVGECKELIYGGCQGNENNFMTKEACEAMCY